MITFRGLQSEFHKEGLGRVLQPASNLWVASELSRIILVHSPNTVMCKMRATVERHLEPEFKQYYQEWPLYEIYLISLI